MADLLGYGSNAPNVVTNRPSDNRVAGAVDTWGKDCSSPGAGDGTGILSGMMNGLLAQLRAAIRGNGKTVAVSDIITEDNTDDTMLLKAIQHVVQRAQPSFGVDSGATNVLVVALSPALAEYKAGVRIRVKVLHDNTGAATINVNGRGDRAIVRQNGSPLQPRDLTAGAVVTLDDDGAQFQLSAPAAFSNASVIVTSSANLNLNLAQRSIALRRAAPAAMIINLPPAAENGHEVIIEDVKGSLQAFPATVVAPAGEVIAEAANYVMNRNFQSTTFRFYTDGATRIWSRST